MINVSPKVRFTENIITQSEPRFRGYSMNTLNTYRRRPWYRPNLKSVDLPVPETIGGTLKIWTVPRYAPSLPCVKIWTYSSSRSSKVIDFGTDRKRMWLRISH